MAGVRGKKEKCKWTGHILKFTKINTRTWTATHEFQWIHFFSVSRAITWSHFNAHLINYSNVWSRVEPNGAASTIVPNQRWTTVHRRADPRAHSVFVCRNLLFHLVSVDSSTSSPELRIFLRVIGLCAHRFRFVIVRSWNTVSRTLMFRNLLSAFVIFTISRKIVRKTFATEVFHKIIADMESRPPVAPHKTAKSILHARARVRETDWVQRRGE